MSFENLNLNKPLLNALDDLDLKHPTPIQESTFSVVMSGKDMVGIAQTGTGKTFAYLLPLLRMWSYSKDKLPQILVLVPTRELVIQVVENVKLLTTYMNFDVVGVFGGVNIKNQALELSNGCDMVIATPGRFTDLAAAGVLKVKKIKRLVIDEFDLVLDLGFRPQLDLIFDKIPEKRQNILFSATISNEVTDLLDQIFKSPEIIEEGDTDTPVETLNHLAYRVPNFRTKINLLEILLNHDKEMKKVLIFVSEKQLADFLYNELVLREIGDISVIHSNKSQNFRMKAIKDFINADIKTLISTDLGSRGLDIKEITHVINMDIPSEPEDYIHRGGRTGRAEEMGTVINLVGDNEAESFKNIVDSLSLDIEWLNLPDFLEIEDLLMPHEIEREAIIFPKIKPRTDVGPAFHEKSAKNKKVNIKRDIEAEKKLKYGKQYRKKR